MSEFLDHKQLGPAIKALLQAPDVRCAVAFWGNGAADAMLPDEAARQAARILCDLSMGGSNPTELKALGAPNNENLRHLPSLHAKVYLSAAGLIIASANASNNGIGFLQSAAPLVEAGSAHGVGSSAYDEAAAWFDSLWGDGAPVDADALAMAIANWRPEGRGPARPSLGKPAADGLSLLDEVAANPRAFRGVGFVFTDHEATRADLTEAVEVVGRENSLTAEEQRALTKWNVRDLFSDWALEDISAWPMRFVNIHRLAQGRIGYWLYERAYSIALDDGRGMVLARRATRRQAFGFKKSAEVMAEADADRLKAIFAGGVGKGRLCENGDELVKLLASTGQLASQ